VVLSGGTNYTQYVDFGTNSVILTGVANGTYTVLAKPINAYGVKIPASSPSVTVS
jgi:hypothetical protein